MPTIHHLAAAMLLIPAAALTQATEPTAVIDTTAGRITCTLLTRDRPVTTARFLAIIQGREAVVANQEATYDATRINPRAAGIAIGTRGNSPLADPFPAETGPGMVFDRPGLLAMTLARGNADPKHLLITDHANTEVDGHAVVFGRCDDASVKIVTELRRILQSTDNHPTQIPVVTHIAIVHPGEPLPPPAPAAAIAGALPPLAPPSGPEPTGPTAILETSQGRIACRLFTKDSPIATSTFLGLADGSKDWTDPTTHALQHHHRFYDGMPFDRVLPDYYLQFGDITGDISGKTDIGFRFANENTPGLTFDRPGRLAFGNGGKDTNNSELFFALNPMHALDSGYTIIGQCDQPSIAVLDRIAHLPRDASNHPLTPVIVHRITTQP